MLQRLIVVAALCVAKAAAWSQDGHELIAEIALRFMTPAAKARAAAILGPDATLVSVAAWADQIRNSRRESAPWHYVNIPISRPSLEMRRDCSDGNCVVGRIAALERELRAGDTSESRRREAMMYLVHFVGDLHQPLHSSDNGDKGGNDLQTLWFGTPMNLHRLWDGVLLESLGDSEAALSLLVKDLNPKRAARWGRGTPEQWADEAHTLAKKVAYGRLPRTAKGTPPLLGDPYRRKALPVARVQLAKAGARLAAELNRILQ